MGLPPGTGYAHTLINNSASVVKAIVIGEGDTPGDKIFYPKHLARNQEMKKKGYYWDDHPVNPMGDHDGWPDEKRPK